MNNFAITYHCPVCKYVGTKQQIIEHAKTAHNQRVPSENSPVWQQWAVNNQK